MNTVLGCRKRNPQCTQGSQSDYLSAPCFGLWLLSLRPCPPGIPPAGMFDVCHQSTQIENMGMDLLRDIDRDCHTGDYSHISKQRPPPKRPTGGFDIAQLISWPLLRRRLQSKLYWLQTKVTRKSTKSETMFGRNKESWRGTCGSWYIGELPKAPWRN